MGKYDDIINLPHHVSKNHPQMSRTNRAAQFAPFAALVGFSESIKNSEELLDSFIELSEDRKQEIEQSLKKISLNINKISLLEVTYFERKNKSNQGKYVLYNGEVKKIDEVERKIVFTNRKSIYVKDIYNIIVKDE